MFLLSACGGKEADPRSIDDPSGMSANTNRAGLSDLLRGGVTFAAVSADESLAAEVGRDVLQNGGNK